MLSGTTQKSSHIHMTEPAAYVTAVAGAKGSAHFHNKLDADELQEQPENQIPLRLWKLWKSNL